MCIKNCYYKKKSLTCEKELYGVKGVGFSQYFRSEQMYYQVGNIGMDFIRRILCISIYIVSFRL